MIEKKLAEAVPQRADANTVFRQCDEIRFSEVAVLRYVALLKRIRGGDRGAAATVNLLSTAVIPLFSEQPQNQDASVSNEEEWEIVMIVDKR